MFDASGRFPSAVRNTLIAVTTVSLLAFSTASLAGPSRTTKGVLLGATAGLLSGNGVNGVLKGAALGAGVGAISEKGRKGKKARKGATIGATVGAVAGVLSGNGIEGAIKGAVVGGAGGAIIGRIQ
ncbi:UPF0757 protein YmgG [Edwardsiella anguillarum]|nr:hypothetical protein CGL57_00380 [Edwardsiella anguillarum]GAJ66539.1 hypothetical protein MA13_contig00002-0247 [Edwardsiella piscicida]BET80471.1 UPF0757 protein YmgG [Edwardsiella anguillarum]BET83759.1 UPF0757 protein YmgG [Edwardsiella anguillarum]BET87126.1 UPF0757 protein YmgG [Edwardsiella anguillarum]